METLASSPPPVPGAPKSLQDQLDYYKAQYDHLATELRDFQETSRELEAELERDAEASEKRERNYHAKIETLGYEVEEWKTKYKTLQSESAAAQIRLEKESELLRDANRTAQLKLRDMELANDDYERQARNTTTSLDDTVARYEAALERTVILEEEVRNAEREKDELRIDAQRARDELNDLRIELDVLKDKSEANPSTTHRLLAKSGAEQYRIAEPPNPRRPISLTSIGSRHSRMKSEELATFSDAQSPASPPLSEKSLYASTVNSNSSSVMRSIYLPEDKISSGPIPRRLASGDVGNRAGSVPLNHIIPRFSQSTSNRIARLSVGPNPSLPRSGSLYQMKGLMGKMQKLEERVQAVKSKLPASSSTQPGDTPSVDLALSTGILPATVTIQSGGNKLPSTVTATQRSTGPNFNGRERRLSHRPGRLSVGADPNIESHRKPSAAALEPTVTAIDHPPKAPPGATARPSFDSSRAVSSSQPGREARKT